MVLLAMLLLLQAWYPLPKWPFAVLFVVFVVITICGSFFIQWNYHLTSLHSDRTIQKNHIALTFDDGPHPEFTPKVLHLLKKHGVKATFFCIGRNIEKYPELFKRIVAEGHSIGNHTYSHSNFFGFFGTERVFQELIKTKALIKNSIGKTPKLYRPAFGVTNPMIEKAVKKSKVQSIGWSVRSLDTTARNEKTILNRIISKIKKGDIILLHDTSQKTVVVLEQLLLILEDKNLKSVTVDELLQIQAYA